MVNILVFKGKSCSNADTVEYLEFENDDQADEYIKKNETPAWFDEHLKVWQYEKYWTRCIKVKDKDSFDLYRNYLFGR